MRIGRLPGRASGPALLWAAALSGACTAVPIAPESAFPKRWRVSSTVTTGASGKSTSAVVGYDTLGRRVRHEISGEDAEVRNTIVYRRDDDGHIVERVDIQPDDLDRYRYRTGDDGRIAMRLFDGNGNGEFSSYLRYAYGPDGLATTRQFVKLGGDRANVEGTEGELDNAADYLYRDGRLNLRSRDLGADGDVDELMSFDHDDDGRLTSITVRRDAEVRSTTRYTCERGPCDLRGLIPEALAYCVDG